jgi:predicted porin
MCKHFYEPEPFVKPLEKIEMKKTLVALAAISAVTGAMADATIYGNIDQAITKSSTSVAGKQTSTSTDMSSYQMGSSQIGFKGEEDLGSGLKASFLHEMGVITEQNGSVFTRQAYVGLSGGFGAVRAGKQYSNAFGNLVSADPFGATGGTGALYVGNLLLGNEGNSGDNPLRQDYAIQYDLPTLVPGVKIGLTKVLAGANSANGGSKTADDTGFAIQYASGPLNVGYTSDSIKAQSIAGIKSAGQSSVLNANGTITTTAAVQGVDAAANSTTKLTTFAAGYDLGMAKITYHDGKIMNNGRGVKSNMTGIAVPMGAATLMYTSGTGKANTAGGDTKLKGSQYGANYALSKRTVAYFHANNSTSTTAANVATKVNGYGLGIHHSF